MTGWVVAALIVPATLAGLPYLLSAPESASRIERLEAIPWARERVQYKTGGLGRR